MKEKYPHISDKRIQHRSSGQLTFHIKSIELEIYTTGKHKLKDKYERASERIQRKTKSTEK